MPLYSVVQKGICGRQMFPPNILRKRRACTIFVRSRGFSVGERIKSNDLNKARRREDKKKSGKRSCLAESNKNKGRWLRRRTGKKAINRGKTLKMRKAGPEGKYSNDCKKGV